MRSDLLSQRIFLAGCFGLPWLWIVHILYNQGLEKAGGDPDVGGDATTNQGLLDADEREYCDSAWMRYLEGFVCMFVVVYCHSIL
jgi:hypothetical protein